jgi:hypothetical protein
MKQIHTKTHKPKRKKLPQANMTPAEQERYNLNKKTGVPA